MHLVNCLALAAAAVNTVIYPCQAQGSWATPAPIVVLDESVRAVSEGIDPVVSVDDLNHWWGGSIGWAQFCDDDSCSVGCGRSVDMGNPGCLNQARRNRKSIKMHGPHQNEDFGEVQMVVTPVGKPQCSCQSECVRMPVYHKGCLNITGYSGDSFRFVSGGCDGNNCDHKCVPQWKREKAPRPPHLVVPMPLPPTTVRQVGDPY
ncbi:hypothetical protein GGR57DRAFT_500888 [Xylariaceae sp. FL1272]|nr:hypothetical protein GGR57DRAFT_500888 [Xylariaceae sp. FL1272]